MLTRSESLLVASIVRDRAVSSRPCQSGTETVTYPHVLHHILLAGYCVSSQPAAGPLILSATNSYTHFYITKFM
jgi:hypothetical protein